MKIIHITDTHLLGNKGSLFGVDPLLRLKKALKSVLTHHSDASFVVITGDIANSGEEGAYKSLKDVLDSFPKRVYLLPGNHDNKEYMLRYFDICKNETFIQHTEIVNDNAFIFLDTAIKGEEFGGMDRERLLWLKDKLNTLKDKNIYLFMHHFPLRSDLPWMDKHANFRTKEEFFGLIERYENVKHIFSGHLHRILQANYKHISISCTRSTVFQVAYTPTSQDDYLTNEESPTYCVALMDSETLLLHHHQFLCEDLIYPGFQW